MEGRRDKSPSRAVQSESSLFLCQFKKMLQFSGIVGNETLFSETHLVGMCKPQECSLIM